MHHGIYSFPLAVDKLVGWNVNNWIGFFIRGVWCVTKFVLPNDSPDKVITSLNYISNSRIFF